MILSEKNNMKKISVIIAKRHHTSLTLEEEFYQELLFIAQEKSLSLNDLITEIDSARTTNNLSSAVRIYILNYLKTRLNHKLSLPKRVR